MAYVWLDRPQSGSEDEARAKMYNALPPNVKYAELFVKLQQEAREAKKGLWATDRVSIPGRLAGSGPWPDG